VAQKPSGGERRWWHGGAAEGTGKGVEGAHGVGAELGVVMGGSERGRSSGPQWLNDGKHGGSVVEKRRRRKEGVAPHGGFSVYSRQRRLAVAA
jgi:hypothetical protein